ncbi:MAG: hypothetical protein NTU53_20640 [Planctomycetota bacterium]|nr:hypothetical protein [Planctomycetota bacterium]
MAPAIAEAISHVQSGRLDLNQLPLITLALLSRKAEPNGILSQSFSTEPVL